MAPATFVPVAAAVQMFDGGSRGNGAAAGSAGYGYVLYGTDDQVVSCWGRGLLQGVGGKVVGAAACCSLPGRCSCHMHACSHLECWGPHGLCTPRVGNLW
jgi:hypothetical protein